MCSEGSDRVWQYASRCPDMARVNSSQDFFDCAFKRCCVGASAKMPHRRHVHSSMVPRDTITPTDSNLQKVKFDIQHDVAFHESFGILQLRFQVDSSTLEDRCLC